MHFIQICSYYITDRFYTNFFAELEKNGVFSLPYVFANKNRKKEELVVKDAVVSYCFNSFDRGIFHLKHSKVLRDFEKKINPLKYDGIHAHSLFSNGYIAYKAKKKYGTPYIITVRYPDVFTFFKWLFYLRPLGRKILLDAEQIIFLSRSTEKAMKKYIDDAVYAKIKEKIKIIPNGIDEFWLENRPEKPRKCRGNKPLQLLFVGRVNKNKNLEVLIKVCELLGQKGTAAELHVVGKIEDRKYEDIFEKTAFLKYHPACGKEELLTYYRNADIFIMLSHKETFGLVYAEAMSQGLPVIYSRGQGFDQQFAEGKVGYSCKSDAAEEAVAVIEKVLAEYEAISENCLKKAQVFSWEKIAVNIKEIYEKSTVNFERNRENVRESE